MTKAEIKERLEQIVEELAGQDRERAGAIEATRLHDRHIADAMKVRKIEALLKERAELWAELEKLPAKEE